MELWIILLSIAVCCLTILLWRSMTFFRNTGIPYSPPWPILGNMADVIFRRVHFVDQVTHYYKRWPDAKYVGFFDFISPVILIRDVELIKSIGVKNFASFHDHRSIINEDSDPLFGKSLFFLTGDTWKDMRNLLSPTFTSSKMRQMSGLMVSCAKDFVDILVENCKKGQSDIEIKDAFSKYTNDVIASCAFGISVNTMKDPDNDFYVMGKDAVNFQGWKSVKMLFVRFCPTLAKWLNVRVFNDKVSKFFLDTVQGTIDLRRKNGIDRPDMIQLLMECRGKDDNSPLDILDITAQAFVFFFAGFDGTSSLMTFAALALSMNPEVQKRLVEDVDEVMEMSKGNPTYEDVNGMIYLEAVLYETLRVYTFGGFLDRVCTETFELPPCLPGGKPFVVKKGTSVWFPVGGIQMDPQYYEDPEKFEPERFLSQKVTINMPTFLAFGIGPRSCIGNRFAMLECKLLLFYLLTKCKLVQSEKLKVPIRFSKSTLAAVIDGGAWVKLVPRG